MDAMSMVRVRVDKKTKRRMREKKEVNWSEVVREAIIRKIEEEGKRNPPLAVLLNQKVKIRPDKGYDSTKTIREWRKNIR
jgi:hypothetical protein